MSEWQLEWQSPASERFGTDMNQRAQRLIESRGFTILEDYGGTDLFSGQSDNGFVVECTGPDAIVLGADLEREVGHTVHVTRYGDFT